MSPVDHVLAARPRVQRRKKIERRWRRCTMSITLSFFSGTDTEQKKRLFPLPPLSVRDKGKRGKKKTGTEVESPRTTVRGWSG